MKKAAAFFLAAALCCAMTAPASAAVLTDQEVQEMYAQQQSVPERASSYFATRMVWASAGSNGLIEFGFEAVCPRVMDHLGALEIDVMRKSGDNWVSVKTYEPTDRGMSYLYGSDCGTIAEAVYYQGTVGSDYFAYITLKAEDSNGSDERIMMTNVVTARK